MKYQYNYSFLERWMEANPKIANRTILQAIGSSGNSSLDLWIRKKNPMPTNSLLRFCNAFDVPISAFLVDADASQDEEASASIAFVRPSVNDQLEPDGGYIVNGEKRPHGSRALRNPLDVDKVKSVVPGLAKPKPYKKENAKINNDASNKSANDASANADAATKPAPDAAAKPQADISITTLNKLLDIVAEQQKTIAEQQKLIASQQREIANLTHGYHPATIDMVAEEIHHGDNGRNDG